MLNQSSFTMSGTQENISLLRHGHAIHDEHIIYWKTQLSSVPHTPMYQAIGTESSGVTQRVAVYSSPFHETRTISWEILSRTGIDAYLLLLSAFKVLLYRYTNQEDILIGIGEFDGVDHM